MDDNLSSHTEQSSVPHVDWNAFSNVDWSVPFILVGIYLGFYALGFLMGIMGSFLGLSAAWFAFLLWNWGISSLFINPFYVIGVSMILGGGTLFIYRLLSGVLLFPQRVYRKITR